MQLAVAAPKKSKAANHRPTEGDELTFRCVATAITRFSIQRSRPAAIVQLAKQHELPAVALTDTGNLHGVVEFVQAAQAAGIKPIIGAELRVGTSPLLLYAANATGYPNLCRLLSRHAEGDGKRRSVGCCKAAPAVEAVLCCAQHTDGLLAVSSDATLAEFFPGHFYRAATQTRGRSLRARDSLRQARRSPALRHSPKHPHAHVAGT